MVSYIAMCISMDGTTPLVDTSREMEVTLALLKVHNRYQKYKHVIFLYLHPINNISKQSLYLK